MASMGDCRECGAYCVIVGDDDICDACHKRKITLKCSRCFDVVVIDADELPAAGQFGCGRCCGGKMEIV